MSHPRIFRHPMRHIPIFAALLLLGCGNLELREQAQQDALHEIEIMQAPPETGGGAMLDAPAPLMRDVLQALQNVRDNEHAQGLFLRIGSFDGAWARAMELADVLRGIRDAGKPVHCHVRSADDAAYALAALGCERLTMTPSGLLDVVGVGMESVYAHELLQHIGVDAEILQIGRYKGAADVLTRQSMPAPVRQQLRKVVDVLFGTLVHAMHEGRGIEPAEAESLVSSGPFTAKAARAKQLIDDVEFDDEARAHAKEAAKVEHVEQVKLGPEPEELGLWDLLQALQDGGEDEASDTDRIALVYVDGPIMEGERRGFDGVHAAPFVQRLRELADDDHVKGVVLRVSSPGGSAQASDRMWHAVRRVAKRKPVVASVGDMAASGGYYVASAATRIFAKESSLVGSIGVVGGKVVVQELASRAGVRVEGVRRGDHAAWKSLFQPFSEEERTQLASVLRSTYHRFLRRVATGRGMKEAELLPMAAGRLMTGRHALKGGLVDETGGLHLALQNAREEAGLGPDTPIQVWPPRRGLLERLTTVLGGAEAEAMLRDAWLPTSAPFRHARLLHTLLETGQPAAVLPYALQIH